MDAIEQRSSDAHGIFQAAYRAVQADGLMAHGRPADICSRPLSAYHRVRVVGAGKAAMAMAGALEALLGETEVSGAVVVPMGYPQTIPSTLPGPTRIQVLEAGHPLPTAAGVRAAEQALHLAQGCGEEDLLVVLISGGGSALWPALAPGISLADAQLTYSLLLKGGVDIHAFNTVRKHLSRIAGGHLAAAAAPAEVVTLVVSDVVGDDLSVIASGPTVPDPTTYAEAMGVLKGAGLWGRCPASVRHHLEAGDQGHLPETPKPGDACFMEVTTQMLATNETALEAAAREAEYRGYHVVHRDGGMVGEARAVGADCAKLMGGDLPSGRCCLLWGGETTVTVRGQGKGGRNQELVLGAVMALAALPRPAVLLSGGTDGIDGPTPAAGAWATPQTAARAAALGLDVDAALRDNDAFPFFDALGQLVQPGPTHTNVMDVVVGLVGD